MVASGLPAWLGFILSLVFGLAVGWTVDRVLMRPMIGQPFNSILILVLVATVFVDGLIVLIWGAENFTISVLPLKAVHILGVAVNEAKLYSGLAALIIFILLVLMFRYTKIGLAMRCVSEDIQVSQSLGISAKRIFSIAWMAASMVAVLSGVLYGMAYSVSPGIASFGLLKGLPVMLLGGMNSIPGALVGGLAVGLVEMLLAQYVEPRIQYECRTVVVMALMLLVLLVRPTGIFGEKEIERI